VIGHDDQPDARERQAGRNGLAERPAVLLKSGNADGGKGAQFEGVAAIVGEIVGKVTFKLDGAFRDLLHDQHGSKLFGNRAESEFYVRCIENIPFAIGQTVALLENDLIVVGDQDRTRKRAAVYVLRYQLVYFGGGEGSPSRVSHRRQLKS